MRQVVEHVSASNRAGRKSSPQTRHSYVTRAKDILGGARAAADLGVWFGATLTQAEVRYLMTQEWARTAADVLWLRSKLGLALTGSEAAALPAAPLVNSSAAPAPASPSRLPEALPRLFRVGPRSTGRLGQIDPPAVVCQRFQGAAAEVERGMESGRTIRQSDDCARK
jgi:hypothetical protein